MVFLEQSFACRTDKGSPHFLAEIKNWSNLKLLLILNFYFLKKNLCRKRLVDKIKPLLGDSFIFTLINSFLHSQILDKKGQNQALNGGRPPVRFLRRVLFHFFLEDLDRNLLSKFPDWTSSHVSIIKCLFP